MCNCSESDGLSGRSQNQTPRARPIGPTIPPAVPLATPVDLESGFETGDTPVNPAGLPCKLDFRGGCYAMTIHPAGSSAVLQGTLRVDRSAPDGGPDHLIVSGDLYTKPAVDSLTTLPTHTLAASLSDASGDAPTPPLSGHAPVIPIFPRRQYHSYLKITAVRAPTVVSTLTGCELTLVAEQFLYTQPPLGQHKGSFPAAPSRTITMRLKRFPAPLPFSLTGGPFYEGRVFEAGVDKGSITLAWVSPSFRRASLEIDTLTGAIPPAPVPNGSGGMEFFDTIFAKIGWQLSVKRDQSNVPVPGGVVPTNCWSSADLHNLMSVVIDPAVNLDADWHVHLLVVPAKLGCSRGVMYDSIGVPRQGCASFSDDGYPVSDSANFGVAANQKQRDIPRAYLRSATHELTHTLNQIHQEIETASDNSIMTTTPSVADVLGGPATGAPGVFPDQINLGHNTTVRHHLNHMPDPVIRPGGWPFSSWFPGGAPQADRQWFDGSELDLVVACEGDRVTLGQPVTLTWTLTNRAEIPLFVPNDVSIEATFTTVTVVDGEGRERPVRPFVILCDGATLTALEPGASVSASTRVFWSTAGFAFERPGRYHVAVTVGWSAQGVAVGARGGVDLFVEYPTTDTDNQAAGLGLHDDVGKWVALGGGAYHLAEACRRLETLSTLAAPGGDGGALGAAEAAPAAPRALQGFEGLMPERAKLARLYPEMVAEITAATTTAGATRTPPTRAPRARKVVVKTPAKTRRRR